MTDFEREDMELESIMGGRFIDYTKERTEKPTEKPVEAPGLEKKCEPVKNVPTKGKFAESQWEPEKPAPNWMDRLKATARSTALYAIVSVVLFWWQQTGRIDYDTAWYALLLCVGMVFFSVGKNWRWGEQ